MIVKITQLLPIFLVFLVSINYEIYVIALVIYLFIVMCCLFIVMVENANDDSVETKPIFVNNLWRCHAA